MVRPGLLFQRRFDLCTRAPGIGVRIAPSRALGVLALGGALLAVVALGRGAVAIAPARVVAALAGDGSAQDLAIVWSIRLPRVILAMLVGGALATAGTTLQAIARNPLADPTLIGVSGGAALGAVASLVAGVHGAWAMPVAAFAGAQVTTLVALRLARVDHRISAVTLLLGGVGLAALTGAGYGVMLYLADDATLRSITFWSLGSLGGATWPAVVAVAIPVGLAALVLPGLARDLDRLALGELEAAHVGVDVDRVVRRAALAASLAVGAAVALCGVIGFVGLVVPYLGRLAVGPGHRALLPVAALGGAALLVAADLVARTAVAPAELPVGVVTAALGAPVLLALVRNGRGREALP